MERGEVHYGDSAVLCHRDGTTQNVKVTRLYQFEGLRRVEVPSAKLGDLIAVAGIGDLNIGETVCSPDCVEALPFVKIDEPTVSMMFMVNNSLRLQAATENMLLHGISATVCLKRFRQTSPCAWRKPIPPTRSRFPGAESCTFRS